MYSTPPNPQSSPPSLPLSPSNPLSSPLLAYLPSASPQTPTSLPRYPVPKRKIMTSSSPPALEKIRKSTPASGPSIGARPVLTLHTFCVSVAGRHSHSKFIHGTKDLTLDGFIEQFRRKHKIDASLHLANMELTFDDMVLGINLDDNDRDWDWEALMTHFGKTRGLVKVIVRAG